MTCRHDMNSIFANPFYLCTTPTYWQQKILQPTQCNARRSWGNLWVWENSHRYSIKTSHSSPLFRPHPLSPSDICTAWQSIISHHLQKAGMGGSREPYLYLIFIHLRRQHWWCCQLKPSVNLPESHGRWQPPRLGFLFNANTVKSCVC